MNDAQERYRALGRVIQDTFHGPRAKRLLPERRSSGTDNPGSQPGRIPTGGGSSPNSDEGPPSSAMLGGRCGGYVGPDTTREELIARGFTPRSADEVLAFREYLQLKAKGETECLTFRQWWRKHGRREE